MRAALQFAAITGIVLPLVPDHALGPAGTLNPYKIWLMVVLISGLGFAGYVAMRLLGARAGNTATALLGGLAVHAILIAAAANFLLKAGLAFTLGGPGLRAPVAIILGATAAIAAAYIHLT